MTSIEMKKATKGLRLDIVKYGIKGINKIPFFDAKNGEYECNLKK